MDIEPEKRIETIMHQYRVYNKVLDGVPFDKLDKISNDIQTNTVPYEIYTEADENLSMDIKVIVEMRHLYSNNLFGFRIMK